MINSENKSLRQIFNAAKSDEDAVFVFDLDCTLIDTRPLYEQMRVNAANLLVEHTGMNYDEAMQATWDALNDYNGYVREAFYDRYGIPGEITTHAVYNPNTMDMSALDVPEHITEMLEQIKGKAYVYTNSTSEYATAMLEALGIADYFEGIYGTDTFDNTRKPAPEAFQKFMEKTGADAQNIWFFEDSIENLKVSKELGWNTVLVTEFMEGNLHTKERQELSLTVDRILGSLSETVENTIDDPEQVIARNRQKRFNS